MRIFTVRLYADDPNPLLTEKLSLVDTGDARRWADEKVADDGTFTRAQIYDGEIFLSEVGYRLNRRLL